MAGRAEWGRTGGEAAADAAFAGAVLLVVLFAAVFLRLFGAVGSMFLLSALVAYALVPIVDRIADGVPRMVAVLGLALGGVGLIVLLAVVLAPRVAEEFSGTGSTVQRLPDQLASGWERFAPKLPQPLVRVIEQVAGTISSALRGDGPDLGRVAIWLHAAGAGLVSFASALLFVPVFVLVMLRGYHRVVAGLARLVPPRWAARVEQRAGELDVAVSGFVRGQLLVAAIIAVLYAVGFSIIGLPLAIPVGLLAGFGELVPYLGGAIALTLGVLLAIAGGDPADALWVAGLFAAVQALEGAVLSPWIVGTTARLGPATIILALAAGGHWFGLTGLLLAVPVAAGSKVALVAAADAYRGSRFFQRPLRRLM